MEETTQEVEVPKLQDTTRKIYRLEPRHKWVLVRILSLEEEVINGIVVDHSQSQSLQAEVVAFPETVQGLAIGDRVIVSRYGQTFEDIERMTGDKNLKLLRDEEVYVKATPIDQPE